jgi:hypothetical protein
VHRAWSNLGEGHPKVAIIELASSVKEQRFMKDAIDYKTIAIDLH